MRPTNRINPHAPTHRGALRGLGAVLAGTGIVFTVIGFGSVLSSAGSFDGPRHFWCAFVGIPLLGIGGALLKFGYLGATSRYAAGEIAPVAADTANFMAERTAGAVQQVAAAVRRGLADSDQPADAGAVQCAGCGADNDPDARFCDQCGTSLPSATTCAQCHAENDEDARFCNRCGTAIG